MNSSASGVTKVGFIHLTLHLVNGGRQQFVQSNSDVAQNILSHLRPERIFAQKQFLISGKDSVTIIPSDSVERVDFRSDPLPDWLHNENISSVHEVSEEEFHRIVRRESPAPQIVMGRPMPIPPKQVGLSIELQSGRIAYLSVRTKPPTPGSRTPVLQTPDDTRMFLQHLFSRPVLFGTMDDAQGIFLLNPANAVRFTLAPPPPEPSAGSWPLEIVIP